MPAIGKGSSWFLDKRDPQRTIDTFIKPALVEVKKEMEKL